MVFYEIKLNPLEIECLKKVEGFKTKLPVLIDSSYDNYPRSANQDAWRIVESSEKYEKAVHEIEKARKKISAEQKKLWNKYPKVSFKGLTGYEHTKKFYSQFSKKDKKRNMELAEQFNSLNEPYSALFYREHRRKIAIMRGLYGIIGIVQGKGQKHKYFYKHLIIPQENFDAVRDSLDTKVFSKEVEIEDLFLLEFLLERTKEIKNGKSRGHNPRFSVPQIVNEYPEDREMITERLDRLTGILCHAYGPQGKPYAIGIGTKYVYWQNWFIPNKNFELAEKTIKSR